VCAGAGTASAASGAAAGHPGTDAERPRRDARAASAPGRCSRGSCRRRHVFPLQCHDAPALNSPHGWGPTSRHVICASDLLSTFRAESPSVLSDMIRRASATKPEVAILVFTISRRFERAYTSAHRSHQVCAPILSGMHPPGAGGPGGSAPMSQEATAAAAANAAAAAAAAVLHRGGAQPSAETVEQVCQCSPERPAFSHFSYA
jgi:hypothetical protein